MHRLGIRVKLVVPVVVLTVALFALLSILIFRGVEEFTQFAIEKERQTLLDGYRKELKSATEVAASLVANLWSTPGLSDEGRLAAVRQAIRPLRFGTDGYYYAYQAGSGINLIHGATPTNEGKSLWDLQSPDKKQFIIRDLDKAAADGSMFVTFWWTKPSGQKDQFYPKLGTALKVPGTDIWVGTGAYIDEIEAETKALADQFEAYARGILFMLLAFSVGAPILLITLLFYRIRMVARPIERLSAFAQKTKGVDFSQRPEKSKRYFADEVTELEGSFGVLFEEFASVIQTIQGAVAVSRASGDQVHEVSQEIVGTLGGAHAVVNDIATAGRKVDSEAQTNLGLSAELGWFVASTADLAAFQSRGVVRAAAEIEAMVTGIGTIAAEARTHWESTRALDSAAQAGARTIETAVKSLEGAEKAAQAISGIVELINDLAERTNLLAMNAAIEAAHAGQVGRGFAVVATEIRTLAHSSADSAGKVAGRLQEIADAIAGSRVSTTAAREAFGTITLDSGRVSLGMEALMATAEDLARNGDRVETALVDLTTSSTQVSTAAAGAQDQVLLLSRSATDLAALAGALDLSITAVDSALKSINDQSRGLDRVAELNAGHTTILADSVARFKT